MTRTPLRQAKVNQLERLYADIPAVQCKGLCQDACSVIMMTSAEHQRLSHALGFQPNEKETLSCPALKDGRCQTYGSRPTICRLYGATEGLPCPHGCQPERVLTDAEAKTILDRARAISASPGVFCTHDMDAIRKLLAQER